MNMPGIETMEIRRIADLQGFASLRNDWKELHQQNPNQEVFLSWEWLYAWWKHYGKGRELWLITAWRDGDLIGIAPLMRVERRKYGVRLNVLCNIGTPDVDEGGFIVKDGEAQVYAAIGDYLITQKRLWDMLELNELPAGSPEMRYLLPQLANSGFGFRQSNTPHLYLPIPTRWNEYIERLPLEFRRKRLRNERKLSEQNRLTIVHHLGEEVTWEDIATIFEVNEHGHFPDVYRPAEEKAFQREIFELVKEKGWLNIHLLYVDDLPIAYNYGFVCNARYGYWRSGFDLRYAEYSVGNMLIFRTIENCLEREINELDFLSGYEPYKARWQTLERVYTQLRFVPYSRLTAMLSYIWLPRLKARLSKRNAPA
jgi:CelD/BcsL family acetyltransferase involved in cellulose biosynthesis